MTTTELAALWNEVERASARATITWLQFERGEATLTQAQQAAYQHALKRHEFNREVAALKAAIDVSATRVDCPAPGVTFATESQAAVAVLSVMFGAVGWTVPGRITVNVSESSAPETAQRFEQAGLTVG